MGLNLCLLCALGWALADKGRRPTTGAATQAESAEAPPSSGSQPTASAAPFAWSKVESSDYSTYIANLRAIGCPEQTIRDIITADIAGVYNERRKAIETMASRPVEASSIRTAPAARVQALEAEQAAVLVSLLGQTAGEEVIKTGSGSPAVYEFAQGNARAIRTQPNSAIQTASATVKLHDSPAINVAENPPHQPVVSNPAPAQTQPVETRPADSAPSASAESADAESTQPDTAPAARVWPTGPFTYEEQLYRAQYGVQQFMAAQLAAATSTTPLTTQEPGNNP